MKKLRLWVLHDNLMKCPWCGVRFLPDVVHFRGKCSCCNRETGNYFEYIQPDFIIANMSRHNV